MVLYCIKALLEMFKLENLQLYIFQIKNEVRISETASFQRYRIIHQIFHAHKAFKIILSLPETNSMRHVSLMIKWRRLKTIEFSQVVSNSHLLLLSVENVMQLLFNKYQVFRIVYALGSRKKKVNDRRFFFVKFKKKNSSWSASCYWHGQKKNFLPLPLNCYQKIFQLHKKCRKRLHLDLLKISQNSLIKKRKTSLNKPDDDFQEQSSSL